MNIARLLTLLGFVVGAAALILQFVISMQAYLAAGRDIPGALGMFFTYYTILTNIVLVLMDNLGYGELGVYGGGVLRGAPTPRVDQLASDAAGDWRVREP